MGDGKPQDNNRPQDAPQMPREANDAQERARQTLIDFVNNLLFRKADPPVQLRELTAEQKKQMEKWITELGDNNFRTREAASKALGELGVAAIPRLQREIKQTQDLEVQRRAEFLVRQGLGGNGLIHIDRDFQLKELPNVVIRQAMGGAGLGNILVGNAPELSRQTLEFQVQETRKFADDLALPPEKRQNLTARRIETINQILEQHRQKLIELPRDTIDMLAKERTNLRNISKLCANLELDLAKECFYERDFAKALEYLKSAVKRDKSLANDDAVRGCIVKFGLDKDETFMKEYKNLGGDAAKIAELAKELEEHRKRKQELFQWDGQGKPNFGPGMPLPPGGANPANPAQKPGG